MKKIEDVQRVPEGELLGAIPIDRRSNIKFDNFSEESYLREMLGIRRVNPNCVEIASYANFMRNIFASAPAVLFLIGLGTAFFVWSLSENREGDLFWYSMMPIFTLCVGLLMYFFQNYFLPTAVVYLYD
ncbi:MAG: hypothetical protein LBE51_19605 [Acidovorax sp.]|jgi:hypothetical protein|nr:hypothetical protein [Acidovorax sp.]